MSKNEKDVVAEPNVNRNTETIVHSKGKDKFENPIYSFFKKIFEKPPIICGIIVGITVIVAVVWCGTALFSSFGGTSVENQEIYTKDTHELLGLYTGKLDRNDLLNDNNGSLTLIDGTVCKGSWKHDVMANTYFCEFPNGSTYTGVLSEEYRPSGEGTFTYLNGETADGVWAWATETEYSNMFNLDDFLYTGMTQNGNIFGYGKAVGSDTHYYIGEFRDGKPHGMIDRIAVDQYIMTFCYIDGTYDEEHVVFQYYSGEGDAVEGKYTHLDKKTLENGVYKGYQYRGFLINNEIVYGTLWFPNSGSYSGTYVNGLICSDSATYTCVNGDKLELTDVSWVVDQTGSNSDGLSYSYTGMIVDGKWHGFGIESWSDSDIYTGEHLKNRRHGYGVYEYSSDSIQKVYEGYWADGNQNGEGTMTYTSGDMYTGSWVDGKREGEGTYTFKESSRVYTGSWIDNKYEGEGTMTWVDGKVYTGSWVNGNRKGEGTMTYANGDVYIGSWLDNKCEGEGTMTYNNGDVYKGSFVANRAEGEGTYTFVNGDIYTGSWVDGKREGEGKYTWKSTGAYFIGHFSDGHINGYGTFYPVGTTPVSGVWNWVSGRKVSIGIYEGTYTGMVSNDTLNGYGTFVHVYDSENYAGITRIIEGEFKNDTLNGYIKVTQSVDGERYSQDGAVFENESKFYTATNGEFIDLNTVWATKYIYKNP